MSATTSEIKKRYEHIEPSAALLRRTERMMAEETEKKKSRVLARRIAAAAISMALVCVLIAVMVFPQSDAKDHVQPLSRVTLPEQNTGGDGRSFALRSFAQGFPADNKGMALVEGVTFEITNISAEGDEIVAGWTVRSTLPEPVYYALEYEIEFGDDIPADYQFSAGESRTVDCFFGNEESILQDVPTLFALTPENAEYSGSFLRSYPSPLPEGEISVVFTLHVYRPNGEVNWGHQGETTAHEAYFAPRGEHLGNMCVYGADSKAYVNNNPDYQQTLIALQNEKGMVQSVYLDALEESGMMRNIFEETHEYRCGEESNPNSLTLTGMEAKLPDRTVRMRSLSITPDTLEVRYTVIMDELEYAEGNAGIPENWLFYVMDDEGKFIASAADGAAFNAGVFSNTPFKGENGKQAYDCWLRLGIALDEMPEYFVFAPHNDAVGQYTGTNAEKFEALYALTAPEECFAISPDGSVIALDKRSAEENGIRFTLTKTDCTSGRIDVEWTVESELDHDIFYFVESEFHPIGGTWQPDTGSGSFSQDYYNSWNLFGPSGKMLTPQNPSFSGSLSHEIAQTAPCPGGVMMLTAYVFRAADGGDLSDPKYEKALSEINSISAEEAEVYISLINASGLFVEETTVRRSFEVPAYENAALAVIKNMQFDFDGKTITIRNLRVTPTSMDMRYEITGADFSEYTGEREYEDMYFAVTAYGSAVGLGYMDRSASNESVRFGAVSESDWYLEKVPEYIVLVPYGEMSYEEYMELRKSRHSGEMFDRLREMYYKEADQSECIRIYMDGRVTTNTLENRRDIPTRTIEPTTFLSTLSEPIGSTLSEPAAPLQAEIVSDSEMRFPQTDRTIVVNHAGIDDGCASVSSLTEEESIFHIDYTVYAPMDGEYGERDGWKFDYFPVLPDGTLANHSTGYGTILTDESGDVCVPQSSTVIFPKDDIPEYITFVPWQRDYLDSALSLEEKDALMQEDADAAAPADCFRLYIESDEETGSNAYRFFIGPDRIEGPYTYSAVYETPSGQVGIIRSEIEDGNQYISYSYPVDADKYAAYLDMDNYSGLYFAAAETSSGISFIHGHKGISTVNGTKNWMGVIMGTLPLDGADEIMLIPYPDGFKQADLATKDGLDTNDVLLAGIYENTAPEEIIRIPIGY